MPDFMLSEIMGQIFGLTIAAAIGLVLGYQWRSVQSQRCAQAEQKPENSVEDEAQTSFGNAKRSLSWLRQMIEKVGSEVEAHRSFIRQINNGLTEDDNASVAISKLLQSNQRMTEKLKLAESRLQEQSREIDSHLNASRTDVLTGLANRRGFDEQMAHLLHRFRVQNEPASLLLIDVDHFKRINDTYGHLAGDEVLRGIGEVLRREVRSGEVAARHGGEEFVVVFPGLPATKARLAAERIRKAVSGRVFTFEDSKVRVTASGGLTEVSQGDTTDTLLTRADRALYKSKYEGRNCGHLYCNGQLLPLTDADQTTNTQEPPPEVPACPIGDSIGSGSGNESLLDPVTGLLNTAAFNTTLAKQVSEARKTGATLVALVLRIDRCQDLITHFGTQPADLVVQKIANTLHGVLHPLCLSRYGNDGFAVVMPDMDLRAALSVAHRSRLAVAGIELALGERQLRLTISIGIAEELGPDASPMIDRAAYGAAYASSRQGHKVVVSNGDGFEIAQDATQGLPVFS